MNSWHRLFRNRMNWLIASFALSIVLTLAACGGSSTAQSSSPAPTQASAATTAPTDTPTTAAAQATTAPSGSVVQVKIVEVNNKYSFQPAEITVPKGGKIMWTNTSDAPHTVTSDTSAFTASSNLMQNDTFSMVMTTSGTFAYHCSIHPYMKANIVVTS